jgi:hypothetical protein
MLFTEEMPRHLRLRATRGLALFMFAALGGAMLCRAALASDITIANPVSGTHVSSPVWIRAHNIGCDSVPPTAFAYSIDNSTAMVRGETAYDIDVTGQVIAAGTHAIHFKSWTARGACPVVSTAFTVGSASTPSAPALPQPMALPRMPSPPAIWTAKQPGDRSTMAAHLAHPEDRRSIRQPHPYMTMPASST